MNEIGDVIINEEIEKLDEQLIDLIHKLLKFDQNERLGANGVDEVLSHSYFKNVDLNSIRNRTKPSPLKKYL